MDFNSKLTKERQDHMTSEIIVLGDDIIECIKDHIAPEEITTNLLSLVQIAVIAHEHAFHFSRSTTKITYLRFVESALGDRSESEASTNAQTVENPFSSSLSKAYRSAQYHARTFPLVTKEALLKFVGDAFDAGEHQRKVYNCEIEGSINNELGVALNFACGIALFGERNGLSPKEYRGTVQTVVSRENSDTTTTE